MSDPMRIGIAGAGSIALGTAAALHQNGHVAMLWSPLGAGTKALTTAPLCASGAIEAEFMVAIASSAKQLVDENDAVIIALPAYGHQTVMDALTPHIRADQHIIISSHASAREQHTLRRPPFGKTNNNRYINTNKTINDK